LLWRRNRRLSCCLTTSRNQFPILLHHVILNCDEVFTLWFFLLVFLVTLVLLKFCEIKYISPSVTLDMSFWKYYELDFTYNMNFFQKHFLNAKLWLSSYLKKQHWVQKSTVFQILCPKYCILTLWQDITTITIIRNTKR